MSSHSVDLRIAGQCVRIWRDDSVSHEQGYVEAVLYDENWKQLGYFDLSNRQKLELLRMILS